MKKKVKGYSRQRTETLRWTCGPGFTASSIIFLFSAFSLNPSCSSNTVRDLFHSFALPKPPALFSLTPIPRPLSSASDGYRSDMSQLKGWQGLWRTSGRRGRSQIDLSLGRHSKCAGKAPRSFKFSPGSWHSNLMCLRQPVEGEQRRERATEIKRTMVWTRWGEAGAVGMKMIQLQSYRHRATRPLQ